MAKKLHKIYIVGAPGSGKSTLGNNISKILKVPYYEVDLIAQPESAESLTPLNTRIKKVTQISSKQKWVAESMFLGWTDSFYKNADLVIHLDIPPFVTIPRVIARYIHRVASRTNVHKFIDQICLPFWILKYSFLSGPLKNKNMDFIVTRNMTQNLLKDYRGKLIVLTSSESVKKFLNSLKESSRVAALWFFEVPMCTIGYY
jgi:adenylate kinase family enzyme